jgi:hypothetical protein
VPGGIWLPGKPAYPRGMSGFAIVYFTGRLQPRALTVLDWLRVPVDVFSQQIADRAEDRVIERWRLKRSSV